MNILESKEIDDSLSFDYFDVQNLLIDHSFSNEEIDNYKDLIFSPNSLRQIYFKGSCDLKTIELIKDLLTISEYTDDRKVEKYLLIDFNDKELNSFLSSRFENPSSWKIPYEKDEDTYKLTDIPRYRTIKSYIKKLDDTELSCVEQIMKVYDDVKLMEYDENCTDDQLSEIIRMKKTNSYGFNLLFNYILKTLGYKTLLGRTECNGKESYITLVEVIDPSYKIHGIYAFDPSMDSLPKEKYESNEVRRINYNFFMCPLSLITRNTLGEKLVGALALLSIDDYKYSEEKKDTCRSSRVLKEIDSITSAFNLTYEQLHTKLRDTKVVSIDRIVKMCEKIYPSVHSDILKENYLARKEELFSKDTKEELDDFLQEEKNKKN